MKAKYSLPTLGKPYGFSMVELLIVMGVLMLLVAVSVPALSGMKRSSDMQVGASRLIEQFQLARQLSRVKNRPVEVRIFPEDKVESDKNAVIQLYIAQDNGDLIAADRKIVLPNGVAFSTQASFSDLLTTYSTKTNDSKRGDYYAFRFRAGGQPNVSITNKPPVITLMPKADAGSGQLPPNFVTLQVEPQTGRSRVYRP